MRASPLLHFVSRQSGKEILFAFGDVLLVLIQKGHKKIKVKVMLPPALVLFLKISKVG
jgi:hypothetical protein